LNPRLLAISLLLAALLSLAWWARQLTTPPEVTRPVSKESPSAIAEQLRVNSYDAEGRLEQTLVTPYMEHFESRDTTELSKPIVWQFNPDSPPWRIIAERALAKNKQALIFLPGKVVIDRNAADAFPPYHIVTRDLTLETDTSRTTTQAPIRIESNQQWITAVGMEGWLRAPIKLNLLDQVKGHYVFD
jgi:lipopolysaccharide export system protein LptC